VPPSAKEVVEKIPVNIKQAIVVRRIFFIGSSSVQFLYANFAPGRISSEKICTSVNRSEPRTESTLERE